MKRVIGNWKMNPQSEQEALRLAKEVDISKAIICPPFVYLSAVSRELKNATLGAQDVYSEKEGAFTGEVSIEELKDLGVRYVIVGHSERRALGEDDALVASKLRAVLEAGLEPILCVGEGAEVRDGGTQEAFVRQQIQTALFQIDEGKPVIIAYEPIWAIGTGQPAKPEDAATMARMIQETRKGSTVLYGGSTNKENIASFLEMPEIGGVLVGGASLKGEEFSEMVKIANNY
ncbi:MAG: triose-phosphate isomerase [Candidatus Paceibacterota bacterium]